MAKSPFLDVKRTPWLANPTAITATTETGLWVPADYTPIYAGDPDVGTIYEVEAGGIWTTSTSGTLTITPRFGLTTGGVSLGPSGAQTVPISLSGVAWTLSMKLVFHAVSSTASSSTCVGTGKFSCSGVSATAGSGFTVSFGGTRITTANTTINSGVFIGWTLSVAGSCTPEYAYIGSRN